MKHLLVFIFGLFFLSAYSQNGSIIIRGGGGGVSLDSNNFWKIHGNSSTNPSTNFLGTTDAQDLVIKTNNTEAMRIDTNGNVGIGTATPNTALNVIKNDFRIAKFGTGIISDWQCFIGANIEDDEIGVFVDSANLNSPVYTISAYYKSLMEFRYASGAYIYKLNGGNSYHNFISNVGISVASVPTAKLHVNGTTRLEGTPQSTTSDSLLTIDGDGNVAWRTPYHYGTDTLTNGVDTVWTSDITSNSMIQLTSNGLNGSSEAGIMDVTAISDGNYFVVNSLRSNTNIAINDQRKYYWLFIRKP